MPASEPTRLPASISRGSLYQSGAFDIARGVSFLDGKR
jgi:hypothetical protein